MALLENYFLHESDTPTHVKVTKRWIDIVHRAPKKLKDGRIKYFGSIYNHIEAAPLLPMHIGKWGNGWDRYGYRAIIHRDGSKTILTPIDDDQFIDNDEMTWGVAGKNASAVSTCLEGGWIGNKRPGELVDFFDLYTDAQMYTLLDDIKEMVSKHPQVKVKGHNQYSKKLCPGFDVPKMLKSVGLESLI